MTGLADKKLIFKSITVRRNGVAAFCAVPRIAFFKERT